MTRVPVEYVPCRDCGSPVRVGKECCGRRYIIAGGRVVRVAVEPHRWDWTVWFALGCGVVIAASVLAFYLLLGCAL